MSMKKWINLLKKTVKEHANCSHADCDFYDQMERILWAFAKEHKKVS